MLTNEEKKELKESAGSRELREDMKILLRRRRNPFIINGKFDLDRYITFLTEFNLFISHNPRPFHKIIDKDMRL